MVDFLKIFFSFFLSGVVGVSISQYFQRRSLINQLIIKVSEKKASEIKEIRDSFEQLSAERIYRAKELIDILLSRGETAEARKNYRDSVVAWNKKLNLFFLDLRAQNLYGVALDIESKVQNNFCEAHGIIKRQVDLGFSMYEISSLRLALGRIESAYSESIKVTTKLTKVADERWENVRFAGTEGLTEWNLEYASTFQLIIAIFHKAPHSLRISCSKINSTFPFSVRD